MSDTRTWKRFEIIVTTNHPFATDDTTVDDIADDLYNVLKKDFPQAIYWVTVGEVGTNKVNENIHLSFDVELNTALDIDLAKKAALVATTIIKEKGLDVEIEKIVAYEFDIKATVKINNPSEV